MSDEHDSGQLATYMVGLLDADDARFVEAHLVRCGQCRYELDELRMLDRALLDIVPPEALLDGPPPDGDLLLQRMVRQVRDESAAPRSRRQLALVAAAVVAIAAVGIGSAALGRVTAPETVTAAPAPGAFVLVGTNPTTGSELTVTITPAAGWVRLSATVGGIPAGQECQLLAVSRDGTTQIAGSWLVSPTGEQNGTVLNGAALVAPADLVAVRVENFDGREFVTATV